MKVVRGGTRRRRRRRCGRLRILHFFVELRSVMVFRVGSPLFNLTRWELALRARHDLRLCKTCRHGQPLLKPD